MTVIEQVLLRKDIASVAVAVTIGFAVFNLLGAISGPVTSELFSSNELVTSGSFAETYVAPIFAFALQVLLLELLLRAVIYGRASYATRKK